MSLLRPTFQNATPQALPVNWTPPTPDFPPLVSAADRQSLFSPFRFAPAPRPGNPEAIRILDGWEKLNIVEVEIPQLVGVEGAPQNGVVRFHRVAAEQLQGLFRAWHDAGLIHLVETWGGSFVPRFIRGSRSVLSNHAFGTAFDINAAWNGLGVQPVRVGAHGSVRELVPIANKFGFFWGGHYTKRRDGMHFEVAKLLAES
jgi:D-alanyl-D-alanine carboxypeptidase